MALRYSCDGASRPLRVLEDCLEKIRSGCFRPDETRSGRFVEVPTVETDGPIKKKASDVPDVLNEAEPVSDCVEVLSSDHATTSSGSDSDDEAVVFPRLPYRIAPIPERAEVWRHVKLRTVHLAQAGYRNILSSGRRITDKYEKSTVDIRFDFIKCKQCFARHADQQQ